MDFYIVLGVERGAALGDIKRAYRRLARKYHPDINPGDRTAVAQFRQIAEAYETLSDPERRRRYDTTGQSAARDESSPVGFEGFDFSVSVSGPSASTFGDLFADVLHQQSHREEGAPARGADLHQMLTIGFEESVRGGQHTITVTRYEHCRLCGGLGSKHVAETRCPQCHGTGTVQSARGHMVFKRPCAQCGGSGQQRAPRCPACLGQSIEMRSETLTATVPPGLAHGARIRLAGKGHAGPGGGEYGDLYVTLNVEAHPIFRREGDDLHVVVPVSVHEAALGARVEVPSIDGPARLRVPPGTQSGQRFRLRERGVVSPRDGRRGDLVVETRLVLPKILDERSKELLREFGKINNEDVRADLLHHQGHDGPQRDGG